MRWCRTLIIFPTAGSFTARDECCTLLTEMARIPVSWSPLLADWFGIPKFHPMGSESSSRSTLAIPEPFHCLRAHRTVQMFARSRTPAKDVSRCCAVWTPNSKNLIYTTSRGGSGDIWFLPLHAEPLHPPEKPVRLTKGELSYGDGSASLSRDGKRDLRDRHKAARRTRSL